MKKQHKRQRKDAMDVLKDELRKSRDLVRTEAVKIYHDKCSQGVHSVKRNFKLVQATI